MKLKTKQNGFSLIEVLFAVATLSIGMVFVGGTFVVGVHLSTIATERTIAAVVADEAFAKVRIYDVNLADTNLTADAQVLFETINPLVSDYEFAYPSTKTIDDKQYFWSALCRKMNSVSTDRLVQVTVFISRKIGTASYPGGVERPIPVKIGVSTVPGLGNENKLTISDPLQEAFIRGNSTIADNKTGHLYRVVQRDTDVPNLIMLDRKWEEGPTGFIWAVPPPVGGGKYPCIEVYQKAIRF